MDWYRRGPNGTKIKRNKAYYDKQKGKERN